MPASDGVKLWSSIDGGGSWQQSAGTPPANAQLTGIGTNIHMIAPGSNARWSTVSRSFEVSGAVPFAAAGRVVSDPGSVSGLWALTPLQGATQLWRSSDAGGSWVLSGSVATPGGLGGGSFAGPVMLTDGLLHFAGLGGGYMFESALNPTTLEWAQQLRWGGVTGTTPRTPLMWPTQRVNGSQAVTAEWMVQTSTGSPSVFATFRPVGAGEPTPSTVVQAAGSVVLSGVGSVRWLV
jgi:hypothetical protein